ncbi:MAG: hypothetical protein HUU11_08745 [Anaerolineales bacterium]|nr:hypothetical protein [Anaerolineales bacterium]
MKLKAIYLLLASALLLAACGGSDAEATPTLDPDAIQTQAVKTFSAVLTQTALAAPTDTPVPTLTASPTFAAFTTSTAGTLPVVSQPTVAATSSCYQMRFVSDVTVPDNTQMAPGQAFTKTWKVRNTGSCAWDAGFKFAFTGGDAMNGVTYTLPSSVPANTEIDVSVAMVAPTNKTGAIRGNWRMPTAAGQFFGDEVYVIIVVGGATLTPTRGAPTATPTNTQPSYP